MNKPIYEIPVTGDDAAQAISFPPPAPSAMPASYSPAPPTVASAPAPTGYPQFPAPDMSAPAPAPQTFAAPPPTAQPSAPPAFDPASFASAPPPVAAPAYSAPSAPVYQEPSVPDLSWPAPPVVTPVFSAPSASAYDIPVVGSVDSPADDLLNFPPPRAPQPAKHAEANVLTVPSSLSSTQAPVDFGADAGYADADPDLTTALRDVLLMNASDLHVSANMPPMVRVDGALVSGSFSEAWDAARVRKALRSIMTPAQEEIFDRDLELDFAYTVSSNARFRVNFYQQREAMGAAFRLIPTEIKQLGDLGVPDSVGRFATLARGLVLITGPTGSGKSTTLAALVDLVNRTRADHIMTVEDPIEFLHGNHKSIVNQREVGNDTHSFGAALKHVLRQDPDVILIGELRDLETISVALTAAETGHLVFATLHTQDAAQTIDRVIDVFPPHQQGQVRSQLAATLQGVVCQTLVKKANGRGRAVATEVLIATPAIANLIREGKTYQISSAMQAGGELGMHTMDRHLADLANSGVITQKAAMDKAQDLEGLKQMIHRVETPGDIASDSMSKSSIDFNDAYSGAAN
jgi:twitching motility protein PilT